MAEAPEIAKKHARTHGATGLVPDCRLMLSFARKNGFVLPLPLLREIGWLDSVLKALEMDPISQVAPALVWPIEVAGAAPLYTIHDPHPDHSAPQATGLTPEEVILDIHAKLSLLIAPTTALSLQTSEPPAGKRHIFGGMPPLVQAVIGVAFVSAVCFVISASQIAGKGERWKARRAAEKAAESQASAAFIEAAAAAASVPRAAQPASQGASK
ncbi:hypothetical protein [Scleromatobacter humisilvae]|uniref:Uncharacterized protein n=1 Tax=Scleromatobacter humisilvae TaxID=2897159 RepID=A0A9X1YLE3_9BURK|nr:hypothetical protein [Scleromatobacter humisilvae]MCK9687040.1 hypothetical protein [Scleromatobacter humisilvae]